MEQGYILLYRKSLESIIFSNEKGWKVWTWCLMKANHKPNTFFLGRNKITLKAGQFVMGKNTAKEELNMAVGTIWYWLDILEKEGNVERKSTNKYSIITILNWGSYQVVERRLNANRTQIEPNNNDNNDNKYILATDKPLPELVKVLKVFESVNPSIKRMYGNKTQRESAANLIKQFGLEKTIRGAEAAVSILGQPYAPRITTPYELERSWAKLVAFFQEHKNKKIQKGGVIL